MARRPYPEQKDCLWLALDMQGQVAAFVTGGLGPMPTKLLQGDRVVEGLEFRLANLPRISTARLLVSYKRPDDFVDLAERGIFAYDWSDVHRKKRDEIGAYELIATPSKPIYATQLPNDVAAFAALSSLSAEVFGSAATLDVQRSLDCVQGQRE